MLRTGIIRRGARGVAKVVGGSAVVGVTGTCAYINTEQGQGLRRELRFWHGVAPVVFDYYWNFASSSPLVKYQKWLNADEVENKEVRKEKLKQLHQQHAPEILNVLLDLKGLYVKLGQVLSVTSLPIPTEYRKKFRTLQSDVPGWEGFEETVKPMLERELGRPLPEVFVSIDPVPCGAASIGQAHKATLKAEFGENGDEEEEVIVKVQYPDAAWQVPADIQCVGDLLKICVFFGVVDESAANLSFEEFSRQFKAELDFDQERRNLQDIYQSSLDPNAPYQKLSVVVPRPFPELCTSKVITMEYLPGPKLEDEARKQLEALGINTSKGVRGLFKRHDKGTIDENGQPKDIAEDRLLSSKSSQNNPSWRRRAIDFGGNFVNVGALFDVIRLARQLRAWCTVAAVNSINLIGATPFFGSLMPDSLEDWAKVHSTALQQARRLGLTKEWIDALFEVHGHQIFSLGCFNADAHPGNILVIDEDTDRPKLGLIDFGQCRRMTMHEQAQVARLVVSVANNESDETIASTFRSLGVKTKNDNTEFLAKFAKLMFGPLQSYHLDHSWHKELHKQDAVTYFPNQLSMVYRTSMLLRGLAISLQFNVSVGDLWKSHAQEALQRYEASLEAGDTGDVPLPAFRKAPVLRRLSVNDVVKGFQEKAIENE